jgi:hypothetical protein
MQWVTVNGVKGRSPCFGQAFAFRRRQRVWPRSGLTHRLLLKDKSFRYARDNIWKHLPAPFHAAKEEFTESVNSIVHFLRSGQLQFAPTAYMPFEHFASAYEQYVSSMGLARMRLAGDKISQPLLEAGCRVAKNQTMRYPRGGSGVMTGRVVVGCDVAVAPRDASPGGEHEGEVDPLGDF